MKEEYRFLYIGPERSIMNKKNPFALLPVETVNYHLERNKPISDFIEISNDEIAEYAELAVKFEEIYRSNGYSDNFKALEESGVIDYFDKMVAKYGRG